MRQRAARFRAARYEGEGAYEAFAKRRRISATWRDLTDDDRRDWEAAIAAARPPVDLSLSFPDEFHVTVCIGEQSITVARAIAEGFARTILKEAMPMAPAAFVNVAFWPPGMVPDNSRPSPWPGPGIRL